MLKVAVIGATGAVGQEFVLALNRHPWFEVTQIASSERSAGKRYIDALRDPTTGITKWHNKEQVPEYVKNMTLRKVEDIDQRDIDFVFTALESSDAKAIEPRFADSLPVIRTRSSI